MLDYGTPELNSIEVPTTRGSLWIAEPLLRVARRMSVPVAFVRGALVGRSVAIDIAQPDPSCTVEDLALALAAFADGGALPTTSCMERDGFDRQIAGCID
jgi:hypothetical protein